MEARVKSSYPHKTVRALQGREFTKSEWRAIPPDLEAEALRLDLLEIRVQPVVEAGVLVGDAPALEHDESATVIVDEFTPEQLQQTTATRMGEFIDPPSLAGTAFEPAPQPKIPAKKGKGKK